MVRSEPAANGTGVIAALDAVAKPKTNAAPRTIVLIIHRSLIFKDNPARSPISETGWREASIGHDEDNDATNRPANFHLDERISRDEPAPRSANEKGLFLAVG
jgi:hypothetical protein